MRHNRQICTTVPTVAVEGMPGVELVVPDCAVRQMIMILVQCSISALEVVIDGWLVSGQGHDADIVGNYFATSISETMITTAVEGGNIPELVSAPEAHIVPLPPNSSLMLLPRYSCVDFAFRLFLTMLTILVLLSPRARGALLVDIHVVLLVEYERKLYNLERELRVLCVEHSELPSVTASLGKNDASEVCRHFHVK